MLSDTERVWLVMVGEASPSVELDGTVVPVVAPEETPLLAAAAMLAEAIRGAYAEGCICTLCGSHGDWDEPHGSTCPAGLYDAARSARL